MANTALFTPMKIGKHELKHRVVLSPLTRHRAHVNNGIPTDMQIEYYAQRATEGGLLITEATNISPTSGLYPHTPSIFNQAQIDQWRRITDAVHAKGGIFFNQLWHQGRAALKAHVGDNVVAPSAIAIKGDHLLGGPHDTPRELSIPEIKQIVADFRQSALNAIEAGFDGIEIHAANGYLLDQFLNSSSNQRTDAYGGSSENRARVVLEIVDAVSDAIGVDRVGIRLSPWSGFQDMEDETPYETWGRLLDTLPKELAYVHFVEPRAILLLDHYDDKQTETLDPFRKAWKGPFISTGGYTYNVQKAIDVSEKSGSLIAFGRLFIANPDLVERIRNGWPLNKYDRSTFYTYEKEGYIDYPFYKQE